MACKYVRGLKQHYSWSPPCELAVKAEVCLIKEKQEELDQKQLTLLLVKASKKDIRMLKTNWYGVGPEKNHGVETITKGVVVVPIAFKGYDSGSINKI